MSPLSLFKRNSTLLPGTVIVWGRLGSPLVNILFKTKLLSLLPLSWDMDCLLTLWLTLPLVPLVTVAVRLVFWSLSSRKKFLVPQPIYTHRKIIKAPLLHQSLGPRVFFVSLSLSLFLANSLERGDPLCSLFCPGFYNPLERAPGAFVSNASPVSRTLLVLCVNQGISASFSLSVSYRRLCTTRFRSIKGPQQITISMCRRQSSIVSTLLQNFLVEPYWGYSFFFFQLVSCHWHSLSVWQRVKVGKKSVSGFCSFFLILPVCVHFIKWVTWVKYRKS